MQHFPSLFVRKDEGVYRFVICSWGTTGWHEVKVSDRAYDSWMDAHIDGAEAVAHIVMPSKDRSLKGNPEVHVFERRIEGDSPGSPKRRGKDQNAASGAWWFPERSDPPEGS